MPMLDVIDETYVVAPVERVRRLLCDEQAAALHVPGLLLVCVEDRGAKGRRWELGGALRGTAEMWLEPVSDGVLVHAYLRADPTPTRRFARLRPGDDAAALRRRYARPLKRWVLSVKDQLEAGRLPGEPRPLE